MRYGLGLLIGVEFRSFRLRVSPLAPHLDCVDDALAIFRSQARPAREAKTPLEQPLRNRAAAYAAPVEGRLQMHRLPYGSRFDVAELELLPQIFTRGAEAMRIDRDARQPAVAAPIRRFRHDLDAGQRVELAPVVVVVLSSLNEAAIEVPELAQS